MPRRPSITTLLAGGGLALVLVGSFLPWYRFHAGGEAVAQVARAEDLATAASFWRAWGAGPEVLLTGLVLLAGAALIGGHAAPADRRPPAVAVAASAALLALVLAWVLHLPGPDELVVRASGGWIALTGAGLAVAGSFLGFDAAARRGDGEVRSAGATGAPAPR